MLEGNIFKIKKDKVEVWKAWCHELNTVLREQARETIHEEGNIHETFLIFELGGEMYTIGLAEGKNLPATEKEINRKHKELSFECLDKVSKAFSLYNIRV